MTFYIGHVYAPWHPEATEAFRAAGVGDHVWRVDTLQGTVWPSPKAAHGLPPQGLLVAREFCDEGEHEAEWHGEDALPWRCLEGPAALPLGVDPAATGVEGAPPPAFLRWLKALSRKITAPVGCFRSSFWGGAHENGDAWIYAGDEETIYVYDEERERVRRYRPGEAPADVDGELVQLALAPFGLVLPTSYFALHTRGFFERFGRRIR